MMNMIGQREYYERGVRNILFRISFERARQRSFHLEESETTINELEGELRALIEDDAAMLVQTVGDTGMIPLEHALKLHVPSSTLQILHEANPSTVKIKAKLGDDTMLHSALATPCANIQDLLETVQFLVSKYPEARILSRTMSPLHWVITAQRCCHVHSDHQRELISCLVAGCEEIALLSESSLGLTAMHFSQQSGFHSITQCLYENVLRYCRGLLLADPISRKEPLKTIKRFFVMVFESGDFDHAQHMLRDLDLNPQTDFGDGYRPLHVLCAMYGCLPNSKRFQMLSWIYLRDTSVLSMQDIETKSTPLHHILEHLSSAEISTEDKDMIMVLVKMFVLHSTEAQSCLTKKNKNGLTPLLLAASKNASTSFLIDLLRIDPQLQLLT